MSLFKTKEWWGVRTSSEECDFGCLCVANFDDGPDDKIIVGSYHGILHVYSPRHGDSDDNPHDVLVESQMRGPILQVLCGKFVFVSKDQHLAVLQPRNVAIYAIEIRKGAVDHGNQCIVNKVYEHKLERTAANMTSGPFGGQKDRDCLCVQSMDGSLSIFESENFTFTRFIPGFLAPGPLVYCPSIDSFITASSGRNLEAYRNFFSNDDPELFIDPNKVFVSACNPIIYQVLAVANSAEGREDQQKVSSGKRINAEWKLNIGECTIDITIVPLMNRTAIMVLGERMLYCVHDSGQLGFMKKLEYNPACFFPYPSEDGLSVSCIVCTHSRQLLVYEGVSLKWATLLDETPVQVTVGTFRQIPGMIVTLTDQCHVTCSYLGSHPSIFNLPHSTQRMPNQATVNDEMSKINSRIKELHSSKGDALSKTKDSDDLTVHIAVPPTIDRVSIASQHSASTNNGPVPSVTVQVILKTARRVADVQVTIHVDEPLACSQKHIKIPAIGDDDPTPCATVTFFLKGEFPPASLTFVTVVHYSQSVTGIPKTVTASGLLPLSLVAWPHDPIKTLDHAVTLETNEPCVNLLELFSEFSAADAGPNCVGLQLIHGSRCTILSSKSSYRYRVQSETYAGLWLITDELVRRLQSSNLGSNFRIRYQQAPNLDQIYSAIDRHLQLRISKGHIQEMLGQRAQQFRAIQRRMLTKFKDKASAPLNCLDTLLAGTYRQILALADACEENHQTIIMSTSELSSSLRLVILLTKLWLSLTDEEAGRMFSYLCVDLKEADTGWEQTAGCSISTLIRTTFSQRDKDVGHLMLPTNVDPMTLDNASKIKKHIKVLFDNLAKGKPISLTQLNPMTEPISNVSTGKRHGKLGDKMLHPINVARDMTDHDDIMEDNQASYITDVVNNAAVTSSPLELTALRTQKQGETYAASNQEADEEPLLEENGIASVHPDGLTKKYELEQSYNDPDDLIDSPSFFNNSVDDAVLM